MIIILFLDIPHGGMLWSEWWLLVNRMYVSWLAVDVKEASWGGGCGEATVPAWRDVIAVQTNASTCR